MNNIRQFTRWLSLLVIASLLLQLAPQAMPAAMARTAHAAPVAGRPTPPAAQAPSLAAQVQQLEQVLSLLEEAPDDAALRKAQLRVENAWSALLMVERATRDELSSREQDLGARGLAAARGRQEAQLAEHNRRMDGLRASYQALVSARGDRQALKRAASALRTALHVSMAAASAPPPKLDLLPNRPAPKTQQVRQLPALRPQQSHAFAQPDAGALAVRRAKNDPDYVAGGQVAPLSSDAVIETPPTPGDHSATEDAAITPEIQALADQLGHSPTRIYEYVRNQIGFEPYYGSRKGSLLTLWERSGNDIDTASLLIALLRASGFGARYVEGTVAINGAQARNWVGNAPSLSVAGTILASGGVPVGLTPDGYLVKEHVWVEVYNPDKTFVDFNGNGVVDVGDIETVARQLNSTDPVYDIDGDGTVDLDDVRFVANRWKQPVTGDGWVALDASFKQYTYHQPANIAALTGFNAEQYVDEVSANAVVSDTQQSIGSLPMVPDPGDPLNNDDAIDFAEAKADAAAASLTSYINAHPNLTNADLLGGGYIITQTVATLPTSLPVIVIPSEPISAYSEVPATLRDYVTVELYDAFGAREFSYQASFPSLANRRVTVSYQAATASDQAVIDSYGGSLLTTPPVVDLVPVLRVNGAEVARGSAAPMGERQTRSLTFTDATGRSGTVQNSISVGETFAVGLAYGHTSKSAIEASQQRLAAARAALPTNASGDPNPNAPGNMAEPVVGEMLHLSLQAYFNQLDSFSEVVARGRDVRWFRYLSAGVAIQNLVFGYCFGSPCQTRGGGQTFDIQQNVVSGITLANRPADERIFLQTSGYFGSALEHSLFNNIGKGAVSSIRLLSRALESNIPVYRISSANKAAVFPLLQINSSIKSYISGQIDQGKVVTVSQRELVIDDWSGLGFIVMDPASGAAAYLISGGLFGATGTVSGGSLWDILKTIAAYAWLAINLGLDLWGIWSGIALLLVPEPTFLTKLAGIGLIVANLAALGFDIGDLWSLVDGSKSAQEYIGEQITGLIVQALLKRIGIAAAAKIVDAIGPEAISKVARQLSELTGGVSDRLLSRGFTENEIVDLTRRLTTQSAWQAIDDVGQRYGDDVARTLANNNYIFGKDATERIARTILNAPNAAGIQDTIRNAVSRGDFGYAYELQRAIANQNAGNIVQEYGRRQLVTFQEITGFDAAGAPILGGTVTREIEGDLVLAGDIWVDVKHGAQGNQDLHIWNQIQKAQAALNQGLISGYRFECSSSMGAFMRNWAATNAPGVQFITNLGDGFP